jgi:hypothetical protein
MTRNCRCSRQCRGGCGTHWLRIARYLDAEQTVRQGPDHVAPDTTAKVEHEGGMTCKPGFRRRPLDLLDQPRFADPSLTADIHSLAAPGLAARR